MRPTTALWHQVEKGAMGLGYGRLEGKEIEGTVNHHRDVLPPIVRKCLKGNGITNEIM
jgi:hypothetical protein